MVDETNFQSVSGPLASHSTLAAPNGLERRSGWRPKRTNIAHGWLAEETAVFAIELAGAFISHLKGCAGGVQAIHEHAAPRGLQAKLFLIL